MIKCLMSKRVKNVTGSAEKRISRIYSFGSRERTMEDVLDKQTG